MTKKIRLGIVGVGNMGLTHFTSIREGNCPEIEVTAVADIKPERLEQISDVACFDSTAAMLESKLIDAALIATPHYDHPALTTLCMKHGIHVMTEKPAGVYTKQVREMNTIAEKSGVVFGMMFNQRTDHIYRKMKEIVAGGGLGRIRRISWIVTDWYRPQIYYNSGAWRATWSGEGGGVLLNQCPHNLDLLQWICGMPIKVDAKLHFGKWHDIEVEDDVTAYFEFANGATGTFITTTGDTPGSNRFEIAFDGGKLVAENGKLILWELKQHEPEFSKTNTKLFGAPEFTKKTIKTDGKSEQHAGVLNAFAGAILRGEPLIANGVEGINGLMLSNAMHLSAWKKKPITLPIDEDIYYDELMKRVKKSRLKKNVTEIVTNIHESH
ncbi:MAG: Gfo/Idh/MocA family oxidoreductase [Oscillospiraceae bacterium]|jgi:predicted dehydrogenase|nr:Gfo/Idh/MocA family oxidoreductase [Oscillospiraceae bacterium]